jgi:hypothetical protein
LTLVSPQDYGTLNKVLVNEKVKIKRSNVSSVFYPSEYRYDLKNLRVAVKGVLKTYSGERLVDDGKRTFMFEYKMVSQKLSLIAYTDVTHRKNPLALATQ